MIKEVVLLDRKILYIGITTFHYDVKVIEKLVELGARVDTFHLNFYSRFINKIQYQNLRSTLSRCRKIICKDYDYILLRHAIQFDVEFLTKLRELNPNAMFVNFHWDSIKRGYNYSNTIKYFDKVFSFDYKDCNYLREINFLPLFFINAYEEFRGSKINIEKKIDILFIGAWRNYERYFLIKKIGKLCRKKQLRFFYYLHYPYSIKSIIYAIIKGIIPFGAKRKFLTHKEILDLFAISNTIIDINSSFQSGLAMRTFETLGAGKKLITTNINIINEPFYNPEYISILDTKNIKLDIDFIRSTPNTSIIDKIDNYSIKNYVFQLLQ